MNRALRAATVGVLLLTPVALTACSAGQVSQTASQVRDQTGPYANIGDLSLRQVLISYPNGGSYSAGDDAELTMSIANSGPDDDALIGIKGDGFDGVNVTGTGTGTPSATGTSSASSTAAATATASATASAAPTSSAAASGSTSVDIPIPSDSTVFLGQNAPTVTLVGLGRSLTVGQSLSITFTFRKAGEVTLDVTVAAPNHVIENTSTFDFSKEPSHAFSGQG